MMQKYRVALLAMVMGVTSLATTNAIADNGGDGGGYYAPPSIYYAPPSVYYNRQPERDHPEYRHREDGRHREDRNRYYRHGDN